MNDYLNPMTGEPYHDADSLHKEFDMFTFEGDANVMPDGDVGIATYSRNNTNHRNLEIPAGSKICIMPNGGHLMPINCARGSGEERAQAVIAAFKAADPKYFYVTTRYTEDYFYLLYKIIEVAQKTPLDQDDNFAFTNKSEHENPERTVFSKYFSYSMRDICTMTGFVSTYGDISENSDGENTFYVFHKHVSVAKPKKEAESSSELVNNTN
jgi:hypothetical protein